MLIVALVLAAIGLASLVAAVVTSNEVLAFVCIAAAAVGVVLMIVDAIRDRHAGALESGEESEEGGGEPDEEHSDEEADSVAVAEDAAEAVGPEADPAETSVIPAVRESATTAAGAVSLKEAVTAAQRHPSAEETYEQFDVDDEDEPHRS
ncbi:hypothetical protein HNP40_003135 [Mycobacteroides chelonae]|nr:hypothetical protein [Mycobacteroides chelonae]